MQGDLLAPADTNNKTITPYLQKRNFYKSKNGTFCGPCNKLIKAEQLNVIFWSARIEKGNIILVNIIMNY